jgi:tetratricopeptide (TPR) repeat protein
MVANGRLESWKEIAVFFNRDERTVKRWEKERGLPVHRYPGTKGRVFAYEDELTGWLTPSPRPEQPEAETSVAAPPPQSPDTSEVSPPQNVPAMRPRVWAVALTSFILCALAVGMTWGLVRASYTVPPHRPARPEAEALYLKGRFLWNKRTPDGLNQALDSFSRALEIDPEYAEAYVGLADTYNLLPEYTPMPASEGYSKALSAAKRALELNDGLADAHRALAFALFYGNLDFASAAREFKRAIQLNPGIAVTHHWYATCLMTLSRFRESLEQIELAQKLDPTSRALLSDQALLHWHLGRRDQAVTELKQVETTDRNFVSPHRYLSYIYLSEKNYPGYLAELKQAELLSGDEARTAEAVSAEKALSAGGPQAMLEEILLSRKKRYAQGTESAYQVASAYALLGKKQEALGYLKTGWQKRDPSMLYLRLEVAFYTLEKEPEYQSLLKQIGLP